MASDGSPAGRRHNGLVAGTYVPLAELDPRVTADVLSALAAAEVAAYVEPHSGTVGFAAQTKLPSRPVDQLFVDKDRREDARAVLAEAMPSGDDTAYAEGSPGSVGGSGGWTTEDDAAFEAIVADMERSPGPGLPSWPASEDLGEERRRRGRGFVVRRPGQQDAGGQPPPRAPSPAELGPRDYEVTEPDEHYVPPPPPPPAPTHAATKAGWAAIVLGALVLAVPSILGQERTPLLALLCVLAILGGTAALVSRLHERPADDPDDGAVV